MANEEHLAELKRGRDEQTKRTVFTQSGAPPDPRLQSCWLFKLVPWRGQTTRHRCKSPRATNSLMNNRTTVVLPAPGVGEQKAQPAAVGAWTRAQP
jgi:hypothetical protein